MVVGITGASGSGKSIIAEKLREKLNSKIVDADQIARKLAEKGNIYYAEIVKYFGIGILDEQVEIDRRKLAEIVYEDKEKMAKLNQLTKDYVAKEIRSEALELEKRNIVIIDVPLLVESGLNSICNIVISAIADEEAKLERICSRDKIDINFARKRLSIQPKDSFYINNSDYIIKNNGADDLEEQIEEIVDCIKHGKN